MKAMLHKAIFLATCNATMANKKPSVLQRGCHTFATFFATCNAYNNKDGGNLAPASERGALIGSFWQNCVASCWGDVTFKQLVSQQQKVEGLSTFLATRNATIAVAKWGVTREFFLATCNICCVYHAARVNVSPASNAFFRSCSEKKQFL